MTVDGDDIGRWLHRQRQAAIWSSLQPGQRERLERLDIRSLPSLTPWGAAKAGGSGAEGDAGAAEGGSAPGTARVAKTSGQSAPGAGSLVRGSRRGLQPEDASCST
ncbi:helicase associated domain-containing protein [Kitasatospora paracochleata]|uniref:helicase associated domain-containing protein n=1 Tax=Kitasatospora paracochleata TaxID=58354 RepID=UPI0031D9231F